MKLEVTSNMLLKIINKKYYVEEQNNTHWPYISERYILFLDDKFRVGLEIDIKLDIKPRNVSGLLVSVHARKDYLVLQMINGQIKFSVDNGKGEISTAYNPPMPHYFCDGEWHNIQGTFY